ncbi:MAG TPA: amidohydrolase family protein [Candidatus Binatia bacterium]|jgi:N-acyl-D-aspartate/D-glutamate deacylase|nr:amidohydrolase family protein [Candidatus Binatia bacterium]
MHDLVIRGGTIVDGTGAPSRTGDVAIDGDRLTAVGGTAGPARRTIDATGKLVTPGWVDIHTHYDGQVTWDPYLTPSSWHGVTTVVMGNCGVGFAPVRSDKHDWLIGLMEGVEDIPGTALTAGMQWGWESFPEYLDAVAAMPRALDVAAQVPHGAVRAYVMGERGARNEPATADDIARMAAIVKDGIAAGAVGFSTSRTLLHRAIDGEPVPGTFAAEDELLGIGRVMGELGRGVFEMASDLMPEGQELAWMEKLSTETRRPITFACLQNDIDPGQWRRLLEASATANARGAHMAPQVAARPTSLLMGLQSSAHPFIGYASYQALAHLPIDERVRRMREPAVRRSILEEKVQFTNAIAAYVASAFHKLFPLGDPPDYEPAPEKSVAAIAEREGRTPQEVAYDLLLQRDGRELLYFPLLNYAGGDFEPIREMLLHPDAIVGLADGGAHCGLICDASMPTFLLVHWVRDRTRGERLPLEMLVHRQTQQTADLYGFTDRGRLTPGFLADVNVIDLEALSLAPPEMVFDLPAGGRRLVQRAQGYCATVKSGEVIFQDGTATGALPGRLLRS